MQSNLRADKIPAAFKAMYSCEKYQPGFIIMSRSDVQRQKSYRVYRGIYFQETKYINEITFNHLPSNSLFCSLHNANTPQSFFISSRNQHLPQVSTSLFSLILLLLSAEQKKRFFASFLSDDIHVACPIVISLNIIAISSGTY